MIRVAPAVPFPFVPGTRALAQEVTYLRTERGSAIRHTRKTLGLTMGDVADALGMRLVDVSDVERGRAFIGEDERQVLLAAMRGVASRRSA